MAASQHHVGDLDPRDVMGCVAFYNTMRVTPDGEAFVAPFHDFTVSLRSVEDGRVIHEFPAHASSVLALAISPDGMSLLSSADDWTVRVWSLDDYEMTAEFETAPGGYRAVAFPPDGTSVVTADISGVLRVLGRPSRSGTSTRSASRRR